MKTSKSRWRHKFKFLNKIKSFTLDSFVNFPPALFDWQLNVQTQIKIFNLIEEKSHVQTSLKQTEYIFTCRNSFTVWTWPLKNNPPLTATLSVSNVAISYQISVCYNSALNISIPPSTIPIHYPLSKYIALNNSFLDIEQKVFAPNANP